MQKATLPAAATTSPRAVSVTVPPLLSVVAERLVPPQETLDRELPTDTPAHAESQIDPATV